MHILDQAIAASAAAHNQMRRFKARSKAADLGRSCPWLRLVVMHHEQIEDAFEAVKATGTAVARRNAERHLATLLTGHAVAEEAVLYPAMAAARQKAHAVAAYDAQSRFKVMLALLAATEPMSAAYEEELASLQDAVNWHILDEEGSWFPALARSGDAALQARLGDRYLGEFDRYMGPDAMDE
ncbi:MAG: hemerythrin domain-containing protein [Vitreoscilla sp.]